MDDKTKGKNSRKLKCTYWQYFLAVAGITALAVIITISLMSCTYDQALADQLNTPGDKVDAEILESEKNMVPYATEKETLFVLNSGLPKKIWVGELKDGSVKLKIEYASGLERVEARYEGNIIFIEDTQIELIDNGAQLFDGYVYWERVNG